MRNLLQSRGRVILATLVGTLLFLVIFFSSLILQTYREYKNFQERELRIEEKLTQARKELEYKEMYLSLMEDPDFLERVARERLGYARPDELLFRFSDEL
ncbi:MAG: cell division protein FtsB [Lentimonas sp.]|jgi:cell division protein FtsB